MGRPAGSSHVNGATGAGGLAGSATREHPAAASAATNNTPPDNTKPATDNTANTDLNRRPWAFNVPDPLIREIRVPSSVLREIRVIRVPSKTIREIRVPSQYVIRVPQMSA